MTIAFILLAAIVILGLALVLAGRIDPAMAPGDRPGPPELPEQPWTSADVRAMRFRVGLRGYRMEDVDAMLDALADRLAAEVSAGADGAPGSPEPEAAPAGAEAERPATS